MLCVATNQESCKNNQSAMTYLLLYFSLSGRTLDAIMMIAEQTRSGFLLIQALLSSIWDDNII